MYVPSHPTSFTAYLQHVHIIYSSNEYKIDAVKSNDGGEYQCAVKVKMCGGIKSNPLTINSKDSLCSV